MPDEGVVRWRDVVPCYLSIQDRDLRIIDTNRLFREEFGAASGELCYRVYKDRSSPCPECPVLKTIEDGEDHTGEETVINRHGEVVQVMVNSAPVLDTAGNLVGVVEMSTNITEVKQLQRQLTMMGMAVAGMAHRIKNILMGLEGGIFVVNTGFEDGEHEVVKEGWEMVERNVGKISRLVKDLLYCSKEREPDRQPGVDPARTALEVFRLYRDRCEAEGITLSLDLDNAPPPGPFDPAGLQTMLTNLVSNAVDACRFDQTEGKDQYRITIRALRGERGAAVLEVEDTGPGIPGDTKHKVFESFFSTKGTEGTGLGLLVVQKVAEEHGGRVTFTTVEGEGTTFTVTIPVREP